MNYSKNGVSFLLAALTATCLSPLQARPYTKDDNALIKPLGMKVMQDSAPPYSGQPSYNFYPLTDAATQNITALNRTTNDATITPWVFQWVNRCNQRASMRANLIYPTITSTTGSTVYEGRAEYTTVSLADTATRVMLAYGLGSPATNSAHTGYQDIAVAAGFSAGDILPWSTLHDNFSTYFTGTATDGETGIKVMTNKIWLPPARYVDAPNKVAGVLLDYEVADDRTPTQAKNGMTTIINMLHNHLYQSYLYLDPLDMPTEATHSGMDTTTTAALTGLTDLIGLEVYSGSANADMTTELDILVSKLPTPTPWGKIVVIAGIGGPAPYTQLTPGPTGQAQQIHDYIVAHGILMIDIWAYYGDPTTANYQTILGILTGVTL